MGNIQVMPEALANQIAAGEVVERPAACVKELIENSLDAGATRIRVALEEGGIAAMTVQDDGCGMDEEDALLAFSRHATSKVRTARDLLKIATMGFRGEALASIAAVARVTLQTRPRQAEAGTEVKVEGSRFHGDPAPIGVPVGTTVVVRDLFFNTPARLKYLRSVHTEQARCVEVVQRAALARPDVAFTLETSGHIVFQSGGRSNLLDVAANVFAPGEAKQLLAVRGESPDYQVTGWIGRPTQAKSTRAYGHIFLNHRPIRNYAVHQAVVAGYGARLMTRKHPLYVLNLEMDAALVDVNIHPHKAEVRFSEEQDVCRMVTSAVAAALDSAFLVPNVELHTRVPDERSTQTKLTLPDGVRPLVREQAPTPFEATKPTRDAQLARGKVDWRQNKGSTAITEQQIAATLAPLAGSPTQPDSQVVAEKQSPHQPQDTDVAPLRQEADSTTSEQPSVRDPLSERLRLRPIGQALGMYILAEDGENLYIIDQHAAHERVLYERFDAQVRSRIGGRMALLTPLTFRLTPRQLAVINERREVLTDLGFEWEPFGGADILLRSVPEVWEGLDISALAEGLFSSLADERLPESAAEAIRDRIVTQACKAAIKANHRLAGPEMDALCRAISDLADPFHCPHGRPILIQLSNTVLEKEFRRIVS
ncbi:DNA mismatch repair endonuclease MutL [Alicyclobacillus sp. ALC3]|uniref:DNA mismatch repair endonuclease MutL n=1 Tax=Alicyclobacillus sp. ALC3 TaxID=2796143 RepID=UPI002379E98D|nr:DNA mismatch repair endonuclease MutL [Alicyclobacillus sp. ALC3]